MQELWEKLVEEDGFGDLSSVLSSNPALQEKLWQQILSNLNPSSNIINNPLEKDDLGNDKNTIMEYIYKNIDRDLVNDWASNLSSHWNTDLRNERQEFENALDRISLGKDEQGAEIIVENFGTVLKGADAGKTFSDNPPVDPNTNYDRETYKEVRGDDSTNKERIYSKNLDFTTEQRVESGQEYQYIRLLMPQYQRLVKVEDLDRNFWVIAQILGLISAYLFGDSSPYRIGFNYLIQEVAKLWENLLYLYISLAVISQKPYYNDFHNEVIIQSTDENDTLYYDNYVEYQNETEYLQNILDRRKFQYKDKNLCLFVITRFHNYDKEYYDQEKYHFIAYNRNTNQTTILKINKSENEELIQAIAGDAESTDDFCNHFYAMKKQGAYINFFYPFSEEKLQFNKVWDYTCAVRTTASWEASISDKGTIVIKNFNIYYTDVILEMLGIKNNNNYTAKRFSDSDSGFDMNNVNVILLNQCEFSSTFATGTGNTIQQISINNVITAPYLGELLTGYKAKAIKMISFKLYTYDLRPTEQGVYYSNINDWVNGQWQYDSDLLEKILKIDSEFDKVTAQKEDLIFVRGYHPTGTKINSETKSYGYYWDFQNGNHNNGVDQFESDGLNGRFGPSDLGAAGHCFSGCVLLLKNSEGTYNMYKYPKYWAWGKVMNGYISDGGGMPIGDYTSILYQSITDDTQWVVKNVQAHAQWNPRVSVRYKTLTNGVQLVTNDENDQEKDIRKMWRDSETTAKESTVINDVVQTNLFTSVNYSGNNYEWIARIKTRLADVYNESDGSGQAYGCWNWASIYDSSHGLGTRYIINNGTEAQAYAKFYQYIDNSTGDFSLDYFETQRNGNLEFDLYPDNGYTTVGES